MDRPCAVPGCENPRLAFTTKLGKTAYQPRCREHLITTLKRVDPLPVGTRRPRKNGTIAIKTEAGWRPEHVVVVEQAIGRPLTPAESVRHKNGNRADNRLSNLTRWFGPAKKGLAASHLICENCGQPAIKGQRRGEG